MSDHNEDFEIPFGDCAQVHENEEPRNSAKERTHGAISSGPTWNASGGHKFFNLASGKLIRRFSWTPIPITQEVIDKVASCGKKENVQSGVVIGNSHDDIDFCEFECDDIEGVHGHDIQQNLCPQN